MNTNNKATVRQQNLQLILTLLDQKEALTAKELANSTNLSIVSINKLIDILISHSEIIKVDHLNTKGRRAKTYKLNYNLIQLGIIQLMEIKGQIRAIYFVTDLAGKIKYQKLDNEKITSVNSLLSFIARETELHRPQKLIIGIPGVEINGSLQIIDLKPLQNIALSDLIKKLLD